MPDKLGVGEVQRVLQHLLREGVSIRDLGHDPGGDRRPRGFTRDPAALVESARQALARTITASYLDEERYPARDLVRPRARAGGAESLAQTPDGRVPGDGARPVPRRCSRSLGRRGRDGDRYGRRPVDALLEPHPPPRARARRAGVPAAAGRLVQRDPARRAGRDNRSCEMSAPYPRGVLGGEGVEQSLTPAWRGLLFSGPRKPCVALNGWRANTGSYWCAMRAPRGAGSQAQPPTARANNQSRLAARHARDMEYSSNA